MGTEFSCPHPTVNYSPSPENPIACYRGEWQDERAETCPSRTGYRRWVGFGGFRYDTPQLAAESLIEYIQ